MRKQETPDRFAGPLNTIGWICENVVEKFHILAFMGTNHITPLLTLGNAKHILTLSLLPWFPVNTPQMRYTTLPTWTSVSIPSSLIGSCLSWEQTSAQHWNKMGNRLLTTSNVGSGLLKLSEIRFACLEI